MKTLAPLCILWLIAAPEIRGQVFTKNANPSCSFGLIGKCFVLSSQLDEPSQWRVETFGGYKFGMNYFTDELDNCSAIEGCRIADSGVVYGLDFYRNISGHNGSDQFLDVGLQFSSIPVAKWNSPEEFKGTMGKSIGIGRGSMRFHFIKLVAKRGHFFYLINSKYIISTFGVGIAIAEAEGQGRNMAGSGRVSPTLGGKLGFKIPITKDFDIGIANNWSVLWYGPRYEDSAFIAGYGLNFTYRS